MSLQLEIYNPTIDKPMAAIEWNHEELKKSLTIALKKYKDIVVTEDTVKEGKQEVAKLRKLSKAVNDKRIEMKKFCLQPYEVFEKQVKEVDALINEPITVINNQVEVFEEAKKQEKHDRVKAFFDEQITESGADFLDWADVWQPNWDNVTKSEKSIQEEILERIENVLKGLETVKSIKSDFSFELIEHYKNTLSVESAITENNRLIELAERKAQAEAQAKAATEDVKTEPIPAPSIPEWNPAPQEQIQDATEEKTYTMRFSVTGTKVQIQALGQFMRQNGIAFSQI